MAAADDVDGAAKRSALFAKYGTRVDAQSAREMLAARLATPQASGEEAPKPEQKAAASAVGGGVEAISDFLQSSTGRTITREVVRGVFGLLKKKR
jgi:hypothetical protein